MLKPLLGLVAAAMLVIGMGTAASAQSSYQIKAGDMLQIEVLEDQSLNRNALVLPDGSISLPLIGSVNAAGRTVDQLRNAITTALAPNFAAPPSVFVSIASVYTAPPASATTAALSAAAFPVYALGEVSRPGRVDVEPGTTLLQFLAASGGLTRFAATRRVQLRRVDGHTGTEKVFIYNYRAVQAGAASPAIVLQAGDVIVVPERRLFE